MAYWMMKTEPEVYSYQSMVDEGKAVWDGVRNYQARNNLMAMKVGDKVLIYHSVSEKAVVGTAEIVREHYPDPTDDTGKWVVVDVAPKKRFAKSVTLQEIKEDPALQEIALVRQSRLSVLPLTKAEYEHIVSLGSSR